MAGSLPRVEPVQTMSLFEVRFYIEPNLLEREEDAHTSAILTDLTCAWEAQNCALNNLAEYDDIIRAEVWSFSPQGQLPILLEVWTDQELFTAERGTDDEMFGAEDWDEP